MNPASTLNLTHLAFVFCFLLFQCGCSSVRTYVVSCRDLAVQPETNAPLRDAPLKEEKSGTLTETMPYRATVNIDEIAGFNPHAGTLWPGALIQGGTIHDGVFGSIVTSRKPLTLTISDVAGNGVHVSQVIPNPDFASSEQARLELLNQKLISPAKFSHTEKEFFSLEHGLLKVGLSANWLGGSLKSSLESEKYSQQHNLIVRFTQSHYTISVEPPSSPTSFFKHVLVDDLLPYSDPTNNPITYVQSVTYGRMAILIISSSVEMNRLTAAIDAAYSWSTGDAQGNLSSETSSVFQSSELKLLVIGGDANLALKATGPTVLPALREFIQNGGTVANALPISYRINYLRNNRPALISFTTDYNRINRTEIPQIKNLSFSTHTRDDDMDDNSHITVTVRNVKNGKVYASGSQGGKYDDHSDHSFGLGSQDPLLIRDLPNVAVSLHLDTVGNDRWKFNYRVNGTTTDGRNWSTGVDGIELSNGNRDRSDAAHVIEP